jgi:hypothetical protein
MKTIYDVPYNGENSWGYRLKNTVTKKWYDGIAEKNNTKGIENPEDYITHSNNPELMNAIANGEIERHIIRVDNSYNSMVVWETERLTKLNAKNDPMSYNENNGMSQTKSLPDVPMLKHLAETILEHHSISGVDAFMLDLSNEKEFDNLFGKLKSSSTYNNLKPLQIREELIDPVHVDEISTEVDDYLGNLDVLEEQTGQKYLVVVLKDYKLPDGQIVDIIIGGNHTWRGFIKSRFGNKVPMLMIPPSIHTKFSKEEEAVAIFGELMNPRNKKKVLETKEADTLKTCLRIARKYGKDNQTIRDLLSAEGYNSKQKASIKGKIDTRLKNENEAKHQKAMNFDNYKGDESKEVLAKKKKKLQKENPNAIISIMSSGISGIGNNVSRHLNNIFRGQKRIDKLHFIVYHPRIRYISRFTNEYEPMMKDWVRLLKHEGVELTWEQMPSYKTE